MENWDTNLIAPFKTPNPLPNAKLISHFLFTRHGSRSPIFEWPNYPNKNIPWPSTNVYSDNSVNRRITIANGVQMDFSKKPKSGFLLDSGRREQEILGKLYYNYLAVENSLLNKEDNYDLSQIYIRSSSSPRCIESGTSFMHGLYKPRRQGEKLIMQTGDPQTEIFCPHPTLNDFYRNLTNKFIQTDDFKTRISLIPDEIKKMFKLHPVDYLLLGDFPLALQFNNFPLPSIIEEDNKRSRFLSGQPNGSLYGLLLSNLACFSTGYVNFCGKDASGPIFNFLGYRIRKFLNNETKAKFSLFSAHDITISCVLTRLGYVNLKCVPPYASHLAVELWDTKYRQVLRFVMNGEPIKVNGLPTIDVQSFLQEFTE